MKDNLQKEIEGPLTNNYMLIENGMLKLKDGWYIPFMGDLKKIILYEFHKIPYLGHPIYKKMIIVMKNKY